MRLIGLEVSGFRAFPRTQVFDLDAEAVVVVGPNGNGKTSLFDAILWGLTGVLPRLGGSDATLLCRFGEAGEARVTVRLGASSEGGPLTVSRVFDGTKCVVTVQEGSATRHGPEADGLLIRRLWPEAASAQSPSDALAGVLTRSVYLQQDLLRGFIESSSQTERFAALSELVGAGRITDLQAELERAKAAWTKVTNGRERDLHGARARVAEVHARIEDLRDRLRTSPASVDASTWSDWWERLRAEGVSVSQVALDDRAAPSAIDSAIKELDAIRRGAERRGSLLALHSVGSGATLARRPPDLQQMRDRLRASREHLGALRAKMRDAEVRSAELIRQLAATREKSNQIRALASLALKFLGDQCPVCEQQFDVVRTRERLEELASAGLGEPEVEPLEAGIEELQGLMKAAENDDSRAAEELRSLEEAHRAFEAAKRDVERGLREAGLDISGMEDQPAALESALISLRERVDSLTALLRTGEALALGLARTSDVVALRELEAELERAKARVASEEKESRRRTAAGDQAQRVIEGLREAADSVVTDRIRDIEPLLRSIYGRIDVHPAFRVVSLLSSIVRGRGHLATVLHDPVEAIECDTPGEVLSSSQMNALGVCTFLALSMGVPRAPMDVCILDDPIQSLDDINLLGLIDLLRRAKDQRQLIVSTHDRHFGDLLARKLRPRSAEQRTVVVNLDAWSRQGPTVNTREVRCDPTGMRLMRA